MCVTKKGTVQQEAGLGAAGVQQVGRVEARDGGQHDRLAGGEEWTCNVKRKATLHSFDSYGKIERVEASKSFQESS